MTHCHSQLYTKKGCQAQEENLTCCHKMIIGCCGGGVYNYTSKKRMKSTPEWTFTVRGYEIIQISIDTSVKSVH